MNGSVWRRADTGTWSYRFDLGPDPLTGKRRTRSRSGFATKKEASAAMRKDISLVEQGRSVRASRRSVADFMDEWHAAIRSSIRPSTWVNYRDYLDAYVLPVIGGTALQDLTPVRLNLLYSRLLESGRKKSAGGLSPKTVQNVHRMLHRALRDAVRWDVLPRNVAEDASPPRARRPKPVVWTPAQLGQFVEHVTDDRFYALWLLVVTTGLRRGELAGLRREDVDLDLGRVAPSSPRVVVAGRAQVSETKTDSGDRSLALDPTTWAAVRDYIAVWEQERTLLGQDTRLLFVRPTGHEIHPDTITAMFHKHCTAAQLPKIRLHDVRHSYATAALKAGVPPKVISERLGHSTAAFTMQTYTHVIPGMDQAAADSVAALILADRSAAAEPAENADVLGNVLAAADEATVEANKPLTGGETAGQGLVDL